MQVVHEAEIVTQKVVVAAHRRQATARADDDDCGAPPPRRPGGWPRDVAIRHAWPVSGHGRTVTAAFNVNCSRVSAGSVKCSVP